MTPADVLEAAARAISPYGWDDGYWSDPKRIQQFDRNQRHVQATARSAAEAVLKSTGIPLDRLAQLASGDAWIAPINASDPMLKALDDTLVAIGEEPGVDIGDIWPAMRDRYLTEGNRSETQASQGF